MVDLHRENDRENQMVDHIHGWLTEQNRLLIKGMQVVHTFLR